MSGKKEHADDCSCEHHTHEKSASHHMDGKCHIDSFTENLIELLKKEFEEEDK